MEDTYMPASREKKSKKAERKSSYKSSSCKKNFPADESRALPGWEAYVGVIETCLLKIVKEV